MNDDYLRFLILRNAKKLFEILDTDRDHKVEFPDLMIFLFCLSDDLTSDQVLKRSFLYYDRNRCYFNNG